MPPTPHRWQFSLRDLFLLIAAIAGELALMRTAMQNGSSTVLEATVLVLATAAGAGIGSFGKTTIGIFGGIAVAIPILIVLPNLI